MFLFAQTDAVINQLLNSGDKPLTLGILAYIVYLLYQANKTLQHSDKRQSIAIKWLKLNLQNLHLRVDNLERFNERLHPNDWKSPNSNNHMTTLDADDDSI